MNPPPRSGHDEPAQSALELADTLMQVSADILTEGDPPQLPRLSQLLMRREQLLNQLGRLQLDVLPPETRQTLQEKLARCQAMEAPIAARLSAHRDGLEEQLRGYKEGRAVMDKYRSDAGSSASTRSEEA